MQREFLLDALRTVWQRREQLQPFVRCAIASRWAERSMAHWPARCQ